MNSDDVMLALSIGGLALSGVFCAAEFRQWGSHLAAERSASRKMRVIYAKIFSRQSMQRAREVVVQPLAKLNIKKLKNPD